MSVMLTRPIGWTFEVDPLTGWIVPNHGRAGWDRGTLVRAGAPVFYVPPTKVDFDVTDPLTWYVKGAGYRPY